MSKSTVDLGSMQIVGFLPFGNSAPTEVHIVVGNKQGFVIVRLKSERAVDEVIRLLQDHKKAVFGPKKN
jgi:hypothetical protein